MTVEKQLEEKASDIAKEFGFLSYKIAARSRRGLPDRIFVGWGKTIFVEFKSPGEKLSPIQRYVISQLQDQDATVYIVDNIKELRNVLRKECLADLRNKTN